MRATICFLMSVSLVFLVSFEASALQGDAEKAKEHYELAKKYRSEGKMRPAADEFMNAYRLDNNYETLYDLAKCESELGNYEFAVVYLNDYLVKGGKKISKSMGDIVKKEIERLNFLISKTADVEPAEEEETGQGTGWTPSIQPQPVPAVQSQPQPQPQPQPVLAPVKSKQELQEEEALRIFENALLSFQSGDYEAALRLFESSYKLYPNYEVLYYVGESALELRDFMKSRDAYERFIRDGGGEVAVPQRQEVAEKIAYIDEKQRRVKQRREGIELHNRGVRLNRERRYEEAMVEFEHAYGLFPDYRVLQGIGDAAVGQKKYDLALSSYERYLYEGGEKVVERKRFLTQKKIDDINKTLEVAQLGEVFDEHYNNGKDLVKSDQKEGAITEFWLAYEAQPKIKVLLDIGKAQTDLKQYEAAIGTYTRYLEEGAGEISENQIKRMNKRIERLRKTMKREEMAVAAGEHVEKGLALKKKKKFDEALQEFKDAYEIDPNYETLLPMAECYVGIGDNKQAVKSYNIYLSKGGSRIPEKKRKQIKKITTELHQAGK